MLIATPTCSFSVSHRDCTSPDPRESELFVVEGAIAAELSAELERDPGTRLRVNLADQVITTGDGRRIAFRIGESHKAQLLSGTDDITRTLEHEAAIVAHEQAAAAAAKWSRPSFDEAVKEFGEKLECYVESPQQATKRVTFRRVPANSVRKYISPPVRVSSADLVLFAGDLDDEDTEFVRLRHRFHWSQDLVLLRPEPRCKQKRRILFS